MYICLKCTQFLKIMQAILLVKATTGARQNCRSINAHMCQVSDDTTFLPTLGYTECSYTVSNCQCTIYTVYSIMTVLLS